MYAKLTIPERLKDLRVVDKHLTLEQLAEQTGLSKSALGKYETDDYKDISPFAIATLADFYGVSTDYLMGLTENREVPNADVQSLHLTDEMIDLLPQPSPSRTTPNIYFAVYLVKITGTKTIFAPVILSLTIF